LPIFTTVTFPAARSRIMFCSSFLSAHRFRHRIALRACAGDGALLSKDVCALRNTSGTPLAVLGCPFNADGSQPRAVPLMEWLCEPASVSHSSDDHEQVQTARSTTTSASTTARGFVFSGHGSASCLHRSNQPAIQCDIVTTPVPLRRRIHTRLLAEPGEPTLIRRSRGTRASSRPATFSRPSRLSRSCSRAAVRRPFTTIGGLDKHVGARQACLKIFHQ